MATSALWKFHNETITHRRKYLDAICLPHCDDVRRGLGVGVRGRWAQNLAVLMPQARKPRA